MWSNGEPGVPRLHLQHCLLHSQANLNLVPGVVTGCILPNYFVFGTNDLSEHPRTGQAALDSEVAAQELATFFHQLDQHGAQVACIGYLHWRDNYPSSVHPAKLRLRQLIGKSYIPTDEIGGVKFFTADNFHWNEMGRKNARRLFYRIITKYFGW